MNKNSFLMATALGMSLVLLPAAGAVALDESAMELTEYDEDARELFELLSSAHLKLQTSDRAAAEEYINEAFEELEDAIEDAPTIKPVAATLPLTKVIELKFGNALMPEVVYVPMSDSPLEVDDLEDELDLTGLERGDVEDARVKYVRLKLGREELVRELNEVREELASGDLGGARAELHDAQSAMIEEFTDGASRKVVARDHVALTRFMLKVAEYEGAREALGTAEKAMVELQGELDGAGTSGPEIKRIKADMDELQDLISRRDPSLADQIDRKLESWSNSLGQ